MVGVSVASEQKIVLMSGRKAKTKQRSAYTEDKIQSVSVTLSMGNDGRFLPQGKTHRLENPVFITVSGMQK